MLPLQKTAFDNGVIDDSALLNQLGGEETEAPAAKQAPIEEQAAQNQTQEAPPVPEATEAPPPEAPIAEQQPTPPPAAADISHLPPPKTEREAIERRAAAQAAAAQAPIAKTPVTIAGKPVTAMSDASLEQIAASSQPAAVKARNELARRKTQGSKEHRENIAVAGQATEGVTTPAIDKENAIARDFWHSVSGNTERALYEQARIPEDLREKNYDQLPKAVQSRVRRFVAGLSEAKSADDAARNFWNTSSEDALLSLGKQAKINEVQLAGDYDELSEAQKKRVRKAVETLTSDTDEQNAQPPSRAEVTYKDGKLLPADALVPFYLQEIKGTEPGVRVSNPRFDLGRIDDATVTELAKHIEGYQGEQRRLRISGRTLKHIEESRPKLAEQLIRNLPRLFTRPDEVLPDHKHVGKRALLVRFDESISKDKPPVATIEIEVEVSDGFIDIVSVMTSPERSLREPRRLKESRQEGQQRAEESANSPHPVAAEAAHAEADFPNVLPTKENIAQSSAEPAPPKTEKEAKARREAKQAEKAEKARQANEAGERAARLIAAGKESGLPQYQGIDEKVAGRFAQLLHQHPFSLDTSSSGGWEFNARGMGDVDAYVKGGLLEAGNSRYIHRLTGVGKELAHNQLLRQKEASAEPAAPRFSRAEPSSPNTFIPAPDGSLDYGEITAEQASVMRRQAGKIRLERGDSSYGLVHIEERHGKQIRDIGFTSIEAFVKDAVGSFSEIWKAGETRQLAAIVSSPKGRVIFIELQPAKDESGDYYTIKSAFPVGKGYVEGKQKNEGWRLLWPKSPVLETAPGTQPDFVGDSRKSGENAPMVIGQGSGASIAPAAENPKRQSSAATQPKNPFTLTGLKEAIAKVFGDKWLSSLEQAGVVKFLTAKEAETLLAERAAAARFSKEEGVAPEVLKKAFDATAKEYGGEAAFEKAKAEGKTKLNYHQWVQVRTPRFKAWFGDWENDPANASKAVDQETGEPAIVGGMFVKHDEPFVSAGVTRYLRRMYDDGKAGREADVSIYGWKLTEKQIAKRNLEPWEEAQLRKYGDDNFDQKINRAGMEFYEMGRRGFAFPEMVVGKRLGASPEIVSWNHRDDLPENGVSVLGLVDSSGASFFEQTDPISAAFMRDRPTHYVVGFENYKSSGSDGEVLLLAHNDLGETGIQIKSATANTGAFSTENPDIRYSANGRPLAFYDPATQTTYLIPENIEQSHDVEGLMHHEIGVHALHMGMDSAGWQSILRVAQAMKNTGSVAMNAAFDRAKQAGTSDGLTNEEALGYFCEANPKHSLTQRIITWFRAQLRAIGRKIPEAQRLPFIKWANALTEADIIHLVREATRNADKTIAGKMGSISSPDIRYSRSNPTPPTQATPTTPPEETRRRKMQRLIQDKMNRFTVIQDWLKTQGVTLTEKADVYRAEERMHGRFAAKAEDFRDKIVKPLLEKAAKAGFSLKDIAEVLHATHAPERNAHLAKINPERVDEHGQPNGAGMSDAQAATILAKASPELKAIAREFQQITDGSLQILLDGGLIADEEAAAYRNAYQHYVPLRGGPEDEAAQTRHGSGLKVRHKEKRALGHGEREGGEWIIENILRARELALLLAEKNLVGKHLLNLALETAREDLITVDKPKKRQVLRNKTAYEVRFHGTLVEVFDSQEAARLYVTMDANKPGRSPQDFTIRETNDPYVKLVSTSFDPANETTVYVAGHEVRAQIKDGLLARAFNNLGAEGLGEVMKAGAVINRYLSTVYTSMNPAFLLKNIFRDLTSGIGNLIGEEGGGMAMKTLANYPARFLELFRYARTGKAGKWVQQYREDGGNTGAAYLSDLERLGKDISRDYAAYQGVTANLKAGDYKNAARAAGQKAFNKTLVWIERLNQAGENAMRLAAYQAMIESKRTRNEAAHVAKNITVNFNRKGELGAQANVIWLFFNANVQGTAALAHAHFKGAHKAQAWAFSSTLAGLGYLLSMAAAGDDEDKYEETSEYERSRNVLIPIGDWGKMPLPFGYSFFWNLGRGFADAQRTGKWGKIPWHLASSFVEEFTPFSASVAGKEASLEQFAYGVAPTSTQWLLTPAMNRTSFGQPLMPENQNDKHQPDREKMHRQTRGTFYDDLAGALSSAGMDVSPETLKYVWQTATGGSGKFVADTVNSTALAAQGAELSPKEIPILRDFYVVPDVNGARARYRECVLRQLARAIA